MSKCTIEGCEKGIEGFGMCQKHYMRWYRYGDPNIVNPNRKADRNQIIVKARKAGLKLEEIGKLCDISHTRVYQILQDNFYNI